MAYALPCPYWHCLYCLCALKLPVENGVEDRYSASRVSAIARRQAVHASSAAAATRSAAHGRAGGGCERAAAGLECAVGQRRSRHKLRA